MEFYLVMRLKGVYFSLTDFIANVTNRNVTLCSYHLSWIDEDMRLTYSESKTDPNNQDKEI